MGKKEDDHNRGQEDGAKADMFDQFAQLVNPFSSEHYDRGFRHGVDTTLEKDPISSFLNPFSSGSSPNDNERKEEVTSSDSQYTDDYDDYYDDDDDDFSPTYTAQPVPVEPEPKPEPIIHTTYSRTETGLSVTRTTYTFETEEEKEKHLRMMAQLEEMCGEGAVKEEEDAEQERLARIFEKIDSNNVLDIITGVASLALMKKKE